MFIKNEQQLLNFVKYSPMIVIIIVAIIINILIHMQNKSNFEKDLDAYKTNYLETNKALVKSQVEKVYNDIIHEQKEHKDDLEKDLRNRVNEAYALVDNIYKKYSHEPKEKILNLIKESLRAIRFNEGRGYYYIHTMDGINVLHPLKPSLENTSIINMQDKRGNFILKDIIKNLKEKDEYISTLYWHKPNDLENEYEKITINKSFKPLNIIIGTGEYTDNYLAKLKKYILENHIQNVRFGKNGYVFVFDYDGVQLAHIKESYLGKNRIDLEDANGYKITQEVIKTAKKGNGYIKYIGTILPETGKPASKTTYIRGIEEWQWAIGAGFYDKELYSYLAKKRTELEELNAKSMNKTMLISMALSFILMFIALYISNILKEFFKNYNEKIQREIIANRKKDVLLYQQTKMASMGEMIGNIAHQWRQPLNMISVAITGMQIEEDFGTLTKEKQKESFEAILKSTNYLSKTIDDFRDFFNPNKTLKECSTKEIYNNTFELIESRIKNKSINIISEIEDVEIMTYKNELIQSLINIVNNSIDAFEFIEEDNKLLFVDIKRSFNCELNSCETDNCQQKDKGCLTITIKDSAGGVPQEYLDKIFDAYFTTKHKSQGTGIGLYMTYLIITKHLSGHIQISNETYTYNDKEYKGAKFLIILPFD